MPYDLNATVRRLSVILNCSEKTVAREIRKAGNLDAIVSGETRNGYTSSLVSRIALVAETAPDFLSIRTEHVSRMVAMTEPATVKNWGAKLAFLDHEEFWMLCLDRHHRLLRPVQIATGGRAECAVDLALLVRRAVTSHAAAVILVHNHPSGSVAPSEPDLDMTRKIKYALETVGITLHDHVIVAHNKSTSFYQLGLLG